MNMKKTTPRYNKIKLLEKNKEKILKSSQERSTLHSEEQK